MSCRAGRLVLGTAIATLLLILNSGVYGQEPKQAPKPATDLAEREELTGDWGGIRSEWKAKGVELEFKASQFVQGVASGGIDTGAVGNGKFQTGFKFDFGKLAGWKYWSAEIKTETRFGGPLLGGTGSINPVNTTAIIPTAAGTAFTISALNVTKLFPIDINKGDLFLVSVGRFNLVDLLDEDFFAGGGTEEDVRFLVESSESSL